MTHETVPTIGHEPETTQAIDVEIQRLLLIIKSNTEALGRRIDKETRAQMEASITAKELRIHNLQTKAARLRKAQTS
jgi:hypothetical protein